MKKNIWKAGNRAGFTLIEIMVAIVLLLVAMLGVISVTAVVVKSNLLSEMITTATTLAKDKIEQAKNDGYDGLATGVVVDYANKASTVQATAASDSIYTRTRTVNAITIDSTTNNVVKKVKVAVQWTWLGRTHKVLLQSIVAK